MQGRLWPRDDEERRKLVDSGFVVEREVTGDDLSACDNVFVAATASWLSGRPNSEPSDMLMTSMSLSTAHSIASSVSLVGPLQPKILTE